MKLLVVGSGGREHAIIRKLRQNPEVSEIFALPGNGGIALDAVCVPIAANDVEGVVKFAVREKIDFAVVAPEDPLCLGMVDALEAKGIPAFGPDKRAAEIEGSKVFAKNLMKAYGIPTARYEVFDEAAEALQYVGGLTRFPVVIKADGLAMGKGVLICNSREECFAAVRGIMEHRVFGENGRRLVIEEFLTGPEISVLAFTDGETLVPMVSAMDHKRALDGDKGLNTGGMGAVAPNPFYPEDIAARCREEIFLPTIRAMKAEGRTFRGCLYFGLMLTGEGPKVIEYNCRFGDPEAQVVLALLNSDLLAVFKATRDGTLKDTPVEFSCGSACCVVLASGGYPEAYKTGYPIGGLTNGQVSDAEVYHAGVKVSCEGALLTAGGRVLGVTASAPTLAEAVKKAYGAADGIRFERMYRREEIGRRALLASSKKEGT